MITKGYEKVDIAPNPKGQKFAQLATTETAVDVEYEGSRGRVSQRKIVPQGVFKKNGNYYVHAYCHKAQDERIFKLDKLSFVSDDSVKKQKTNFRPTCIVAGCNNLAEIKSLSYDKETFYKFCKACRASQEEPQYQKQSQEPERELEIDISSGKQSAAWEKSKKKMMSEKQSKNFSRGSFSSPETDRVMICDDYEKSFMSDSVKQLRTKLLEFSRRNNLINFNQSDRTRRLLRVVDEVPSVLLSKLSEESMQFVPLPDVNEEPEDEKTEEFKLALLAAEAADEDYLNAIEHLGGSAEDEQAAVKALRTLKDKIRVDLGLPQVRRGEQIDIRAHAKSHGFNPEYELPDAALDHTHKDNDIQTLLMPDDLEKRLKSIFSNYTEVINDKGLNVFYACFGFLRWVESKNSEQQNFSPLVLLPIEINRTKSGKGHKYSFSSNGAEPILNQTLVEKLRLDLGVELPAFYNEATDDTDEDEGGFQHKPLETFFEQVKDAIAGKDNWSIARWVSFGFFNYQDIVIFNDLDPLNWSSPDDLLGHELVARLLGGLSANDVSSVDTSRDIDALTLSGEIPHLIMPADSSQHSAIIHALEGKPLVIQGPPGTGKSQTIANLIAALVTDGKRVLFLAEKQPALNVVKDRLDATGLGDLVFNPKVSGDKSEVYGSLRRRNELEPFFDEFAAQKASEEMVDTILRTKDYEDVINATTPYCEKSLYDLIWITEGARNALNNQNLPFYLTSDIASVSEKQMGETVDLIQRFVKVLSDLPDEALDLSGFGDISVNIVELEVLQQKAKTCFEKLNQFDDQLSDLKIDPNYTVKIQQFILTSLSKIHQDYSEDCINFIKNNDDALSNARLALDHKKAQKKMEDDYPFLSGLEVTNVEQLQTTVKQLEEIFAVNANLLDKSLQNLQKSAADRSKTEDDLRHFLQSLSSLDGVEEHAPIGIVVSLGKSINEEGFSVWSDILFKLGRDRLNSLFLSDLGQLSADLAHLENDLEDLPTTVDFSAVMESFKLDELERIRAEYSNISFGASFFPAAKRAKSAVSSLGIDPSNKELAVKWFDRLIQCYTKARAIDNDPRFAGVWDLEGSKLHQSSKIVSYTLTGLRVLLGYKDDAVSAGLLRINPQDLLMIAKSYADASAGLERASTVLGGRFHSSNTGDLLQIYAESGMIEGEVLNCYRTLNVPNNCTPKTLFDGKSLIEGFTDYFEATTNGQLIGFDDATLEGLNQLVDCAGAVAELETHVDIDLIIKLLSPQQNKNVAVALECLLSARKLINEFGEEFDHTGYQVFDSETHQGILSELKQEFEDLAKADKQTLITSGKGKQVYAEAKKSFDPNFFDLLRQAMRENDHFDESLAKQFFVLRVSQSILRHYVNNLEVDIPAHLSETLGSAGLKFQKIDKRLSAHASALALAVGCSSPVPRGVDRGPVKNWTEQSLINRELNKERRHLPIRQLVRRATRALLGLKPVWFLNPVGVSQFVPRQTGLFDVVIIDEASQMLPEKAIAGIARGKNVVVVGDNKQMPPTNWLKTSVDFGEDEEEEVDAESILDLAQQRVGNSVSLRWHYRSRHPSLINFSNHNFYDDKLEIFPTPSGDKTSLGVKGVKVDGVYKGQVNQVEVEEVVLQAKQLMERCPDESLGIVAINRPQMELIKQALEASNDPVIRGFIERWENDPLNAVFVKNLDNVQGDERDNIIISTVYGRDEDGRLFQRFASVATKNGHRRLNVLITRAKNRVILITSLNANDVKLNDNAAPGKRVFRDYIEYAMTGKLDAGIDLKQEADSDFEVAVGQILLDAGYEVTPQVGVRGFRIDLGVKHQGYPHGFLAGIECDGATFHSSASARDRDAVRQQILESLGWKIYRVWSTDWFSDPSKERDKMLRWLSSIWSGDNPVGQPIEASVEPQASPETVSSLTSGETDVFLEEPATPSGKRGVLDIDGEEVEYWKPVDGLYELWVDGRLVGFTEEEEIEVADANAGFAKRLVTQRFNYKSELLKPKTMKKNHNTFEIGLRWIYQQFIGNGDGKK